MVPLEKGSKLEEFYQALSISKKDVCWTCVFRFILENKYFNPRQELERSEQLLSFLISILLKYDCSDNHMLFRFLDFCFRWYFRACPCRGKPSEERYIYCIMKPLKVLMHAFKKNIPLSKMDLEFMPICSDSAPFLSVLSKYGIQIHKSVFHDLNGRSILMDFLLLVQENSEEVYTTTELQNLITRIFLEMNEERNSGFCIKRRGDRYLFLLIKTLQAINMSYISNDLVFSFLEYLNVFYRTIPDPFVSQEDMEKFLRMIWATSGFQPDYLTSIVLIYKRLFGEKSPNYYSPRPLKHLCRIYLRNILKKDSKLLPTSVRRLSIPRSLHDYLLCLQP